MISKTIVGADIQVVCMGVSVKGLRNIHTLTHTHTHTLTHTHTNIQWGK